MNGNNPAYRNGMDLGYMQSVFHKKTERINWKALATVDTDKIIQQNDIQALKDNIKHVAFCDIDCELNLRDSDKSLVKIFKLSQLMVDYLLSSQDYLVGELNTAEERCQMLVEETEAAKRKLRDSEMIMQDIKRECHRRKRLILAQQQIMDSGPNTYHRCPYCEKAFLNRSFLQAHLEKRHADRYIREWYLAGVGEEKHHKESGGGGDRRNDLEILARLERLLEQRVGDPRPGSRSPDSRRHRHAPQEHHPDPQRDLSADLERERRDRQREVDNLQDEIQRLRNQLDKGSKSHLGELQDDDMNRARDKAIQNHKKKPVISKGMESFVKPRSKSPKEMSQRSFVEEPLKMSSEKQVSLSPERRVQPRVMDPSSQHHQHQHRQQPSLSPRPTESSPVRRSGTGVDKSTLHDSLNAPDIDYSPDLIGKFCDEVRHMLDDHLELHGIPRGTEGISGAVLHDKLKLVEHEQSQLKTKYVNYDQIRRRLEAEVDKQAREQLKHGIDKPLYPQTRLTSPDHNRSVVDRVQIQPNSSARSNRSSQSEWDQSSRGEDKQIDRRQPSSPPRMITTQFREADNQRLSPDRSSSASPTRRNLVRKSSDFSNTFDSSAWQRDSNAVTSVPPEILNSKQNHTTNRSSEYEDYSDFSMK